MKRIQVTLSYKGFCKVSAIKGIRAVSGLGLKDAKDIVDAKWNTCEVVTNPRQQIIVTVEQFGALELLRHTQEPIAREIVIHKVEILPPAQPEILDFTANGVHA